MPVTIQHNVTDDEYARLLKGRNIYLHKRWQQRQKQSLSMITQAPYAGILQFVGRQSGRTIGHYS